jgi:hypothetical protein
MFFRGSRYEDASTVTVTTADGRTVSAIRIPRRSAAPIRGYHLRTDGQRLDLLAHHFLADPTRTWLLCDANGAICPDALAARQLVGIPSKR